MRLDERFELWRGSDTWWVIPALILVIVAIVVTAIAVSSSTGDPGGPCYDGNVPVAC